jgi:hypothetical protein
MGSRIVVVLVLGSRQEGRLTLTSPGHSGSES